MVRSQDFFLFCCVWKSFFFLLCVVSTSSCYCNSQMQFSLLVMCNSMDALIIFLFIFICGFTLLSSAKKLFGKSLNKIKLKCSVQAKSLLTTWAYVDSSYISLKSFVALNHFPWTVRFEWLLLLEHQGDLATSLKLEVKTFFTTIK